MSVNYKSLSLEELKSWFEGLVEFKTSPKLHQYACMAFALGENITKVMFGNGIGTGKTLLALYLLKCWNPAGKILIVCPSTVIHSWEEQIKEHTEFSYTVLRGTKNKRFSLLEKNSDIHIINYEGLRALFIKKIELKSNKKKKKLLVDTDLIRSYGIEAVVFDECHHVKSINSQQSKVAHIISKFSRYSIAMTGTLIGKDLTDLWSEYYVLNDGATLGDNFMEFLNTYFYKPHRFAFSWEPKRQCGICGELYGLKNKHMETHGVSIQNYRKRFPKEVTTKNFILERVSPVTISYSKDECTDLPEKIYQVRTVEPIPEMVQVTEDIIAGMKVSRLTKMNIENHAQKLVQITSGFLMDNGEIETLFSPNPKLAELRAIIQEINQINQKTIIYHYYNYESGMIVKLLYDLGIESAVVNGNIPEKQRGNEIYKFRNKCNYLVAHPKTGGEGLNLQHANCIIYYSNSFIGSIAREQSEGRIHRQGQTKNCLYIDIVMEGTIDEALYNSLRDKGDSFRSVLGYIQNFHRK
jgi:SNF2 family DNA or RNA helicase